MRKLCSFRSFFLPLLVLFGVVLLLTRVSPIEAATGTFKQINFQGKVVNKTVGTNVSDGSYTFTFSLYTVSSGGVNVWTETKSVVVTNGIFQTLLGDTTSLPGSVDFNTDNLYLGINFNSDGEMAPRVRLAAVPQALNALKVAGLTVTDTTGTLTVPNGKTISFAENFTTSGANPLTLTTNGTTNVTLPATGTLLTNTAAAAQTVTSTQTIGTVLGLSNSTGLSGAIVGQAISLSGIGAQDQTGLEFNLSGASGANLNDIVGSGSTWKVSKTGALTVASCSGCGGGGSTLQQVYDADADGSNTTVSLTAADDGLVFTNPSSSGTDSSAFLLQLSQANTTGNVSVLDIVQSSNAANGVNLTANSIDGETALAITTNALTSGEGISVDSSSTGLTGNLASFTLSGSNAANTGAIVSITNSGAANTNVGLSIAQSGTGAGIQVNNGGTGSLLKLQTSNTDKFTVNNNGSLTINGADSSIVRASTTEFALGTVGSNLANANGRVQLSDGTPANSGQGTITTSSQPAVDSSIGAGAMSISRADGKFLVIKGGATNASSIYDSIAGAFTSSQTIVCNGITTVGVGAIALPRPNGMYTLICGVAASTTTATSNVDPMGNTPSTIGPALITAVTGAGAVAFKRPDGKYLVTIGASTPGSATNVFDPVANSFTAGPAGASGTWSTGSLSLPMPDGRSLIINGGSTSTTNIYNPNGVSATNGTFTVGPSLDGAKTAGTCGINGVGSVALKRQDGKYVILSKASVQAVYDPSANTMTCNTGVSNVSALGDGAHAIPLQNGKFLIFAGGNTTTAFIYNQDLDTFSTYTGTAPTAITTGAHSLLQSDGSWQVMTGTNTCTTGCTNNFNTGLPMSDPFPSQISAGTPSGGGSCTAGTHSYYATFVGVVESELSIKSNIVSCTAGSGTVTLTTIPVGPIGTTARKIYRTSTGDVGTPQLLTTINDNTTLTFNDTVADGSLGAAYSVTAASTWYTSEDISNAYISTASTLKWTAQLETVYNTARNQSTNTAFKVVQFYVKTAENSSGCATPLENAQWQEVQNIGDSIRAVTGANCVKIAVHFNRAIPKKLLDDRGTWMGNNSTVLRYDYTTPALFDYSIDNSAIVKKTSFDFSAPTSATIIAATVPVAPTSSAPAGTSGACSNGNHFWFVSFVINGAESALSPASVVRSCAGGNQTVSLILPTGPSGTTARKIYRTAAGFLVTDTPFLVGTQSDNSTTAYDDGLADTSLGAAYAQLTPSGPILSRAEGTRVEAINQQLTLPYGRITPTTQVGTTGFYQGVFGNDHPQLNNVAGIGTSVIARDDKTFLVLIGGSASAELYDPVTQTFTNQTGTGNVPTGTISSGSFSLKRPDGKFLVVLGGGSAVTNIYDQYAPPGSRFTLGPALTGTAANQAAFAILNADGTFTILPGNAATTTSIYDPFRNTMTVGPLQTIGTNMGGHAIPLAGPNNNIYKVIVGTTLGGAVSTTTTNYNANSKIFTAGTILGVGAGSGAFSFQRQDGFWILVKGDATGTAATTTSIINPITGTEAAGIALINAADRGTHVIPRADGTFLIVSGNLPNGVGVTSNVYFPWGGIANAGIQVQQGTMAAGPTLVLPGTAAPAAPTAGVPTAGGLCTTGTHLWRYTHIVNGIESAMSAASASQTCDGGVAGGTVGLTTIAVGPTGTTARRVYRTIAGSTTNFRLLTTLNDNVTTTFSDTLADGSLTTAYFGGGAGDGAVSFQRPDGKFVTIFGGAVPSRTVNIYDAGWFADGQYLSEQMNVPAMAANSTIDWQQTSDQFVRMAVRSASSQAALGVASYRPISSPGGSIENAANDTWAQVQVNFRRDFPTFSGGMNGVYNSSGGMTYAYRQISLPMVNSFQINNGMDLLSLQNNGLNVFRVTSNGNIFSSPQGGFFSGGADLAENYTSTQALEKGEVVMIDQSSSSAVLRSMGQYQQHILGVVSTAPGFVAGGFTKDSYPIALVGRVPVRVSTENGPIRSGDMLTSASIPGYAMRATFAGRVLGQALESFDPTSASPCPSEGLGNVATSKCGSITVFINLTDYDGDSLSVLMDEQETTDLLSESTAALAGLDTGILSTSVGGISLPDGAQFTLSTTPQEKKMLEFLKKLRDQRTQSLTPRSQILTDEISVTGTITAPRIIADEIFAKNIRANSIEGLEIYTDQLSSLSNRVNGIASQSASVVQASSSPQANIFTSLIQFINDVIYKGNVVFLGRTTFNNDSAGFAVIKTGADQVQVIFTTQFTTSPVVVVSPDKNVLFAVTNVDEHAFWIQLNQVTSQDIRFSWTATSVDSARTFESTASGAIVQPSPSPFPLPTQSATPQIAPNQLMIPSASSFPVSSTSTGSAASPSASTTATHSGTVNP